MSAVYMYVRSLQYKARMPTVGLNLYTAERDLKKLDLHYLQRPLASPNYTCHSWNVLCFGLRDTDTMPEGVSDEICCQTIKEPSQPAPVY